jgi:phycobilisome rod-core linker protein
MSIPLLTYPLSSQNQRVYGYEIPGDEHLPRHIIDHCTSPIELDQVIWASYRQIFHEQQMIEHHRQPTLESQLRHGQMTVREFMRGLALSDPFRRLNYEPNSNYRFVEICIQRLLGRQVYNEREKLSWSIVLATQGLRAFIDQLIDSDEYLENFGEYGVPYQRRRVLNQRSIGELPFERTPRYDSYHLNQLRQLGQQQWGQQQWSNQVVDFSAPIYRRVLFTVPTLSIAALITVILLITAS